MRSLYREGEKGWNGSISLLYATQYHMEKINSIGDIQHPFVFNSIMRLVLFQQGEWKQTKGGVILGLIAHEQRQECLCTLRCTETANTASVSENIFCCWAWAETQGKIGYKGHQISFQVAVAAITLCRGLSAAWTGFEQGTEMLLARVPAVQIDPHRCLLNRLVHKCYNLPTLGKF